MKKFLHIHPKLSCATARKFKKRNTKYNETFDTYVEHFSGNHFSPELESVAHSSGSHSSPELESVAHSSGNHSSPKPEMHWRSGIGNISVT